MADAIKLRLLCTSISDHINEPARASFSKPEEKNGGYSYFSLEIADTEKDFFKTGKEYTFTVEVEEETPKMSLDAVPKFRPQ